MQNRLKKAVKLKPYSRWAYSTSSTLHLPYCTEGRSCTTLPKFTESQYAR